MRALNGHPSCVKLLLGARAEPEALAKDGETPLSLCRKGLGRSNAECKRLVEEGHRRKLGAAHPAAGAGARPPFADFDADFDTVTKRFLSIGLLTEAMFDGITDAIARGSVTEGEAAFTIQGLQVKAGPSAMELAELVCRPKACLERLRELLPRTAPDELDAQLPRSMLGGGTLLRAGVRFASFPDRETQQDLKADGALLCAEQIALLLAACADPDALSFGSSTQGLTPLMASLGFNDAATLALLEGGADVNKPDGAGYAPLLAASEWSLPRVVRLLLEFGARTDVVSPTEGVGYTPLMAAVVSADADCVGLLLEAGADAEVLEPQVRRQEEHAARRSSGRPSSRRTLAGWASGPRSSSPSSIASASRRSRWACSSRRRSRRSGASCRGARPHAPS